MATRSVTGPQGPGTYVAPPGLYKAFAASLTGTAL